MKHVTYADQSVLVGDEAADTLVRFAALLSDTGHADTVVMNAIDGGGDFISASFVLGSGVNLMTQTTSSPIEEPDNAEAVEYMNSKMGELASPPVAQPSQEAWPSESEF
jgi:hypothetical protein